MNILFVEDHPTFGRDFAELMGQIDGVQKLILAKSKEAAFAALDTQFFDLIVLDLTIPENDAALEVAKENGQAVFYKAIAERPGTSIFILTGSEMDDFTKSLARHGEKLDLWGANTPINTLDYFEKEAADRILPEVERIALEVRAVNCIAINSGGRDLCLSPGFERCIRVVARRLGASSADIASLSGGFSRARVLRVNMRDKLGRVIYSTVAKLGAVSDIDAELTAYNRDAKRLPLGAFPPLADQITKGGYGDGGIFYTVAEAYGRSLFKVLHESDEAAANVVRALREGMKVWIENYEFRRMKVSEVRRRFLWDEDFEKIKGKFNLDLDLIEESDADVRISCIHGDLHGANVLVNLDEKPVLIDFGDVGEGASCYDPITLELSSVFHPEGKNNALHDLLIPILSRWPSRDEYERDHPFPNFSFACREWAHEVGGSDRGVLATVYAYLIRQLRFETVSSEVTLRVLGSVIARLQQ